MPPPVISKPRKKVYVSNAARLKAVLEVEGGKTRESVARALGVNPSCISKWRARQHTLATLPSNGLRTVMLRHPEIDQAMIQWVHLMERNHVNISLDSLQGAARDMAAAAGVHDFTASNGWAETFRNRHKLTRVRLCGEANSVDTEVVTKGQEDFAKILERFKPEDTYNGDETGLFFKYVPCYHSSFLNARNLHCLRLMSNTTITSNAKAKGTKKSKDRLTVLFFTNATGSDRFKPLVIGKSARPRCMKRVNLSLLPLYYRSNGTSWMTIDLFLEYLRGFDRHLGSSGKLILFLDGSVPHRSH
jgi:hypothetical protein